MVVRHARESQRRPRRVIDPARGRALADLSLRQLGRSSWTWFTRLPAWHPVVITLCLVVLYVATHADVAVTQTGWSVTLR